MEIFFKFFKKLHSNVFFTAFFVKNLSSEIKCLHDFVQIVSIIHMKASGEVNECARGSDLCQMEKLAPRRRGFYLKSFTFFPSYPISTFPC